MSSPTAPPLSEFPAGLHQQLADQFQGLSDRLEGLERRIEQRLAEIKCRQDEDLLLLKALSCQIRGRAERADRSLRRRD